MEDMSRRRGRPVRLDSRRNRINVRLSDKELNRVRQVAESYNISINEVFRLAFDHYFRNVF